MKDKNIGFWHKMKDWIEKLIFPKNYKCIFCGRDISNFDEKPYCSDCEKKLPFNNKKKCLICDEPIENEANVCDSCQKNRRYFKKAFCPFVYQDSVRSAILGYKDDNKRYLAKPFAKLICDEISKSDIKFDIITFVPMTKKKQKARSFNQAELLAKEIGEILGVNVLSLFEKVKDDKAQKNLNFKERQEAMKGLYIFKKTSLKKTQNILIVDDIITTCATINYCASLIEKRVNDIYVCAIARNKLKK